MRVRKPSIPMTPAVFLSQIWRKSYRHKLRYHMRGNDPVFVEDCMRVVDGHIEDAVAEVIACAQFAPEEIKAERCAQAERRIVEALMPPEQLARQFQEAWAEKTFSDYDAILWDGLTVVLSAALVFSAPPASSFAGMAAHVIGTVGVIAALASAFLRRVPVGRLPRLVHWAMRWTRRLIVGGALASGSAGVSGFFVMSASSHGVSIAGSFDHLPAKVLTLSVCFLLASQRELLQRSENWLRRYIDIEAYRRDIDSERYADQRAHYEAWLEDQKSFGFFTEQ